MPSLTDAFEITQGDVVTLVGAGGKTSLMFALARELAASGGRVLTTTTTKILVPAKNQSPETIIAPDIDVLLGVLKSRGPGSLHITAARGIIPEQNKLAGYPADFIGRIKNSGMFDYILVEGDGAAGRPLKAPADYEPVIPSSATKVVAVAGLDAVGRPLDEFQVKRHEIYSKLTGLVPGLPITPGSVACIVIHPGGLMKGTPPGAVQYLALNKADDAERIVIGERIADVLNEFPHDIRRVVICGRDDEQLMIVKRVYDGPPIFS